MQHKIKSVAVRGFKSHLDSTFEYAPGLTVVTGPSDTGKSAGVMQPVKWVAFGEPSGEDFLFTIRDEETQEIIRQAEQAEVVISTYDGIVVKKVRRKGKTTWYLNDMEKPISEKADVPDEVRAVLGLSVQTYGEFETSLNFAYQLEAPFIISETPSVGAKVLGKLAGTEVVDKAIGTIGKKVYKARDERSAAQKTIDRTNVELIEFLQLDDLVKEIGEAEELTHSIDQDAIKAAMIKQQQSRYTMIVKNESDTLWKLKQLKVVPDLIHLVACIDLDLQIADAVYPAYSKHTALEEQISRTSFQLKQLEELPTVQELVEEVTTANMVHTDVFRLISEYSGIESRIQVKTAVQASLVGIKEASELMAETDLSFNRGVAITELRKQHTNLYVSTKRIEDQLEVCMHTPAAVALLTQVDEDYKHLEAVKALYTEYSTKERLYTRALNDVGLKESEFKAAEEELTALWRETGGSCPLCGQELYTSHLH